MRDITVVLPFYRNPGIFKLQIDRFESFPDRLRKHLRLIVVDDGSPKEKLVAPESPPSFPLALFRVDVDVRWNWLTCRNIGHKHAQTDWVLFTDIDHLILEKTARRVIEGPLDVTSIYRFERCNYPNNTPYKPHPNTWLMTRDMFDRTGGYDERFSGHYGTDGMFRDRCAQATRAAGGSVIMLKEKLQRVDRQIVPDASTRTYERKAPEDKEAVPRIRAEIEASGDRKPHRLTFPYHEFYRSGE